MRFLFRALRKRSIYCFVARFRNTEDPAFLLQPQSTAVGGAAGIVREADRRGGRKRVLALKLVVDNYPTESIRRITPVQVPGMTVMVPGANDPFEVEVGYVDSKERTLNEIEHEIIRARFVSTEDYDELRAHFALVCAAMSCRKIGFTGKWGGGRFTNRRCTLIKTPLRKEGVYGAASPQRSINGSPPCGFSSTTTDARSAASGTASRRSS